MKRIVFTGALLLAGLAWVPANETPQPQVSFSLGSSNSLQFEWQGVIERTYFAQWSTNLERWDYLPDIEHGTGLKLSACMSTSPKHFIRLHFSDIPTADPETADFDLDGLGNRVELNLGTDPLAADSDRDGLGDGAEIAASRDPLSDSDGDPLRAVDSDGDGVSDAVELLRGTSPTLWDSDGDGFSDGADAFPLDPLVQTPASSPGDVIKPTVTLNAPANATIVSGP